MQQPIEMNKGIFVGHLEFGNERSFTKVLEMYNHRVENYYRNKIVLKAEDIFQPEDFSLDVPRVVMPVSTKYWKNTVNLLEYVAEYAMAGDFKAWLLKDGKSLDERLIEPTGDKAAVQAYLKGRELVDEEGRESDALKALNKAIQKFERHAQAYERRGYHNFKAGNYEDALYDFSKSIKIHAKNPKPYLGRAYVHMRNEDWAAAAADLDAVTKNSIAHEEIFWQGRRLKADMYLKTKDYPRAQFELEQFTKRIPRFTEAHSSYAHRADAWGKLGQVYEAIDEPKKAVAAYNAALEIEPEQLEWLVGRAVARKAAGQSGYVKDLKSAAKQGSKRAKSLMTEWKV